MLVTANYRHQHPPPPPKYDQPYPIVAGANRYNAHRLCMSITFHAIAHRKMNPEERAQLLQDCDEMGTNADESAPPSPTPV